MHVAFVSSVPPAACGVADYTAHLVEALARKGILTSVIQGEHWGLWSLGELWRRVNDVRPDILHIQYPTVAYGSGLGPLALIWRAARTVPVAVTVHEFSQAHPLRRIAVMGLASGAHHVVFTNPFERGALTKWLPQVWSRSSVVPIGSNIPFTEPTPGRNVFEVAYFGLIRPNKGLEAFLDLARMAASNPHPFRFVIIGALQADRHAYLQSLKEKSQGLDNLAWESSLTSDQVAARLARCGFAYLPFPDGASERRGSLLAALGNGAVVVTTRGPQTPASLGEAVVYADKPAEALKHLEELLATPDRMEQLRARGRAWAQIYSWDAIAEAHLSLYKALLHH